ncbi:MAG: hypothetical protein MZV64_64815 [Ignavibacteriales bacterium]|nr:hypothetical protein [Ignavibacteriales bacterium]
MNVNPTVAAWSGLEEDELTGQKLAGILNCKCSIDCLSNEDDIASICPLISQSERLAPTEGYIVNKKTKSEKAIGLNFSEVTGIAGEPTYVIVLRDITDFKEMDKMREDFIATLNS